MTLQVNDSLIGLLSGIGGSRDKSSDLQYSNSYVQDDQQLRNMYETSWRARKVVDLPALDAVRNWRNWQAEAEQITAIERTEKRLGAQVKFYAAQRLAHIYGMAAIFIGTDQQKDPEALKKPLDWSKVGLDGVKFLTVMSKRELAPNELEQSPISPHYGYPKSYQVVGTTGTNLTEIHPSWFAFFYGDMPADILCSSDGQGISLLKSADKAIKEADSTAATITALILEAKVDVFKYPDLAKKLSQQGGLEEVLKLLSAQNAAKGTNNALVLDGSFEYEQKIINFSGLKDLMEQKDLAVAAAAGMPLTRFLGTSPAGLSSNGEGDRKNYYETIKAKQSLSIEPAINTLDECLIRSALGDRPSDIYYKWSPLEMMSDKDVAEIGNKLADTLEKTNNLGVIEREDMRKLAINAHTEAGTLAGIEQITSNTPDLDVDLDQIPPVTYPENGL